MWQIYVQITLTLKYYRFLSVCLSVCVCLCVCMCVCMYVGMYVCVLHDFRGFVVIVIYVN
jgi:hypothetical protein